MYKARQFSLFAATIAFGALVGGVLYSHIVFFPGYMSHLPESNKIITEYGVNDGNFWMVVHPIAILATLFTLVAHWRSANRRRYILTAALIYALAIVATALYFLPNLFEFAESLNSTVSAAELQARGQTWQYLSWIRGTGIGIGFVSLLIALSKDGNG